MEIDKNFVVSIIYQDLHRIPEMNEEEKIAANYLHSLGFGDVKFEPDGNIPPDFSIGKSVGVEVRRLNQHFF